MHKGEERLLLQVVYSKTQLVDMSHLRGMRRGTILNPHCQDLLTKSSLQVVGAQPNKPEAQIPLASLQEQVQRGDVL
jgi:hypothetical protein